MNVMHLYTNLGAVPSIATRSREQSDPLLAHTGPAARRLMAVVRRYPADRQVQVLDRALDGFQPGTAARVRRVASHLRRQGMSTNQAVERALALSLADSMMEYLQRVGRAHQRGELLPVGGLGETGDDEMKPEDVVVGMVQGVLCSQGLQQTITDAVGRSEGQDAATATAVGYGVAQGIAQCPPGTTPAPAPPPPPPETRGPSLVLPIAVGVGALALVGGIVWMAQRK